MSLSIVPRFSTVDKALLIATGNSLVICGDSSAPFINTSDLTKPDGTPTREWQLAGSTATLSLLPSSTILYAELVWYSTVFSHIPNSLDLRSIQDNPITLTTPQGTYQISPQYMDSYTGSSTTVDRYRAADVTTYVQAALSGNYTVSAVPISVPPTGLSNSRAGWTLTVAYRNNSFTPQKILYASGIFATTPDTPFQGTFTGFTTSSDATLLKGYIMMTCANGGPLAGQDAVYAGPSFAGLRNLGNPVTSPNANPGTAPNNPSNNFFAGIINVADPLSTSNSLLNITGTNGTHNNDGFIPMQALNARNKWDITNIDISNTLTTNQSLIALQITSESTGDGIQLLTLGSQVAAKAPNIIATLTSYDNDGDSEFNVEVNESLVYSVQIRNDGDMAANNVTISADLDTATSFVTGSVIINGVTNQAANIVNSIQLGTIAARSIVNVFFTVKVNAIPTNGLIHQLVNYNYQFISGIDDITNYGTTNSIEVIVQDGILAITKVASKASLQVGETVTYTIQIENTGTELAQNLFFQDKIDTSSSFVQGSVIINNAPYETYNPVAGFSLPNLPVGDIIEITFQTKLDRLPPSGKVSNRSAITFGYVFNQYGYLREKTIPSNTTTLTVLFINVIGNRCNNNNYPNIGDTVTYTINLTNVGTMEAMDFAIQEPAIPGATFVEGSVKINGTSAPTLNPFTGFTLTNPIAPKATSTVEYKMLINSLDPNSLVENIANVPFKYQIIPGGTVISEEKDSNTVDTVTNYVCMQLNKRVDKSYATINDILYYTVEVRNGGNINALNTTFLDTLQANLSFITGSVAINGIAYPSYNPNQGFSLGTICPSDVIEVTFQATVLTLPLPHIVYNQASLVYSYKPDPAGSTLSNTIFSNTVETIINQVQYSVVKTVDKNYAQIGDYLVYTTTINNTGTVPITDMSFADFIGVYLTFYPGTVYINGVNYPDYNPANPFSIGTIHPGDTTTIVFGVSINSHPPVGYIPNMSEVSMTYQVNPNTCIITKTTYSNIVSTYVPYAFLSLIKQVDKAYALVGDTLTYSFTATNTGTSTAINTLFSDMLPTGTSFVPNSVFVNGINKPSYNPQTGFTLGNLYMGQTVTIDFKVTVTNVPTPNTLKNTATTTYNYYINPAEQPISKTATSNTVTTVINAYSANLTKYVDKAYATIGDELSYTIVATNTGTVPLTTINFIDIIPTGATFITGSVTVEGVSKPNANPNSGFIINDVPAGGNVVVMFRANVTSIPTPQVINNTSYITFKYQLTPTSPYIDGNLTSNTATTSLSKVTVTNVKSVNKTYATKDDVLTYTSTITNTGIASLDNTQFIDNIASQLTFVPGSVKINGIAYPNYNPHTGFTLGNITTGTSVTVSFDATVTSIPASGYVTNHSTLNYDYKIDPNQPYIVSSILSNTVTTYINYGNVTVIKSTNQSVVKLDTSIIYSFIITNTGNTPLKDLLFKDTIQAESLFNPDSVYINDINQPNFNPNTGFSLTDIPVGQQTTIRFTVTTNTLPPDNRLFNTGNLTYSYYVDPDGGPTTKTESSNTTTVYVYDTIMSATKTVDKTLAKLTDTLNFTITVKNEGNTLAQNIFFQDILDSHITLVTNSVYINGVQKLGYDPTVGFNLDNMSGGDTTTTITFSATISSRPANNIIPNYATINYNYTVGTEVITATIHTNTTQTSVAVGELTVTKTVDKTYATINNVLGYTVTIANTGSVDATAINFTDLIPPLTSFVTGSVVIDGIAQTSYHPNTGFALTDLAPNQTHVITFNARVDSLPVSGEVNNTADITFTYKLLPTDDPTTTTTHSNTVTTYIRIGYITSTKAVDKTYATIGDTLNYAVTLENIGNANCFEVLFQDIVQSHASFITGSVKINGIAYENYNPNTGFYLPDIAGGSRVTVTFAVTVLTLPPDYTIYNHANVNFKYYVNPSNLPVIVENITNTVLTQINVGSLTTTKAVSKAYATLNDILSYTITIANTGSTLAKYVNFRDVLPIGLTFQTGSVTINGISYPAYDPYASFSLGNITAGTTVIIKFDARVTSLPTPSLVSNTANITFAYRIDPNGSDISVIVNSNTVTTQINVGALNLVKSVNLAYAVAKDILTYTVIVTNTGNVRADNINFSDNLQSDITFNIGSVTINGTPHPDYNPITGFSLGNIEPLDYVTVIFTVTVIDVPTHTSVLNLAEATFSYNVNPNGQYYSKTSQSNTVYTVIIIPKLSISTVVNKIYATLQETLSYTMLVKNEGNETLFNLFFTNFLSNGATFTSGTVLINGTSFPTYDPIAGFNLPSDLLPGDTALIEFKTLVTSLPLPPQVTDYAVANGQYRVDPTGSTYPISATSNTVTTHIHIGSLSNTKSVDKMYARVNDTVTYTSTITNTGNINATSLFFTDSLQSALSFVSGTVTINNIVYPTLNPVTGFSLSNLAPGQTTTVAFTVKITALPTPAYVSNTSNVAFSYKIDPNGSTIIKDQLSNTVTTNVVLGEITAVKTVDKSIATIGDVLTYTITLTNVGNVITNEVFFQDTPSTGATFRAGSVKVNGVSQPTFSPIVGFGLGDIGIGNVVVIEFNVDVVSVPTSNQITNQAAITFNFVIDPKQQPDTQTIYSNAVTTNIAYGQLNVTKAVNKQYATIGEQITYTVTIVNIGNINATNVVFLDPTPNNSNFVLGSVTINGTSYPDYNPAAGFNLNTMLPGQIITVVYKVEVINLCR